MRRFFTILFLLLSLVAILWNFWKYAFLALALALMTVVLPNTMKVALEELKDRFRDLFNELLQAVGIQTGFFKQKEPSNDKPFKISKFRFDGIYRAAGVYDIPMNIYVTYNPRSIELPEELHEVYFHLRESAEATAKARGVMFYNGPNTRLIRVIHDIMPSRDGTEIRRQILELGPVSWLEYSVLNTFLDYKLRNGKTIREAFACLDKLYDNGSDFRWCSLSNIMPVAMIPVTTDGYGLLQRRSSAVSTEPGAYTSGVAENIHRFLDEAPSGNLYQRRVPLLELYDEYRTKRLLMESLTAKGVDDKYQPEGVPSPFLTAKRDLFEEISKELYDQVPDSSYKFLNVAFGLKVFVPNLVGVIELGKPKVEVEELVDACLDESERRGAIQYVMLDEKDGRTEELLLPRNRSNWTAGGLAALISAIRWYKKERSDNATQAT